MTIPAISNYVITQNFVTTYIDAFPDQLSGSTNPPTCGPRTCTSNHNNVVWNDPAQKFEVKTLGTSDVPGAYTVTVNCQLSLHPSIQASQTFTVTVMGCSFGNEMIAPQHPNVIVTQDYITSTLPAFSDVYSGTSNPPTCLKRTCSTTGSANVIWDDTSQQFTIKSLGPLDVPGNYQVSLICSLTNHPSVPQKTTTFVLTIPSAKCGIGNTIQEKIVEDIIITQDFNVTTFDAFGDIISGSTSPPLCGPRNCSTSGSANVVWNNTNQKFTVKSLGKDDVVGTYVVIATCSLTNYPEVAKKTTTFKVKIPENCSKSLIIVPGLQDIFMDQYSEPTILQAFSDSVSLTSNPPTCGNRNCQSNHPNVNWDQPKQLWKVQYNGALDRLGTNLVNLKCSLADYPSVVAGYGKFKLSISHFECPKNQIVIAYIDKASNIYLPDLAQNQDYHVISKHNFTLQLKSSLLSVFTDDLRNSGNHQIQIGLTSKSKSCEFNVAVQFKQSRVDNCTVEKNTGAIKCQDPPYLKITKMNIKGKFSLKFSEPMHILALNQSNTTNRTIQVKKLMNLTLVSTSSFDKKFFGFKWNVTNLTSTEIEIQVKFDNPTYISKEKGYPDIIIVKLLPKSQDFFYSNRTGLLIKDPLRKTDLICPNQLDYSEFTEVVQTTASVFSTSCKITVSLYILVQIILSLAMERLWTMQNALNMILALQLINLPQPANVVMIFQHVRNIVSFNVIPADELISENFSISPTSSPGWGFESASVDGMRLIPYLGIQFFFIQICIALYILLGLICMLAVNSDFFKKIEIWLKKQLIYGLVLRLGIQSYFDLCCGCLLSLLEPKFITVADYIDMVHTYIGTVFVVSFPLFVYFFLNKNQEKLKDKQFSEKFQALYEGFAVAKKQERRYSKFATTTFLLRRLLIALNVVYLKNQTVWLQLFIIIELQLIEQVLRLHWKPMQVKSQRFIEAFNDFLVLLMCQITFLFTDLIIRPDWQYIYGWIYNGVAALLLITNVFYMLVMTAIELTKKIKRKIRFDKYNKRIKMLKRQAAESKKNRQPRQVSFQIDAKIKNKQLLNSAAVQHEELKVEDLSPREIPRQSKISHRQIKRDSTTQQHEELKIEDQSLNNNPKRFQLSDRVINNQKISSLNLGHSVLSRKPQMQQSVYQNQNLRKPEPRQQIFIEICGGQTTKIYEELVNGKYQYTKEIKYYGDDKVKQNPKKSEKKLDIFSEIRNKEIQTKMAQQYQHKEYDPELERRFQWPFQKLGLQNNKPKDIEEPPMLTWEEFDRKFEQMKKEFGNRKTLEEEKQASPIYFTRK